MTNALTDLKFSPAEEPDLDLDAAAVDYGIGGPGRIPSMQMVELTGLTYRELDYGTRQGVYPCTYPTTGSGQPRHYTLEDLLEIVRVTVKRDIALQLDPFLNQRSGRAAR